MKKLLLLASATLLVMGCATTTGIALDNSSVMPAAPAMPASQVAVQHQDLTGQYNNQVALNQSDVAVQANTSVNSQARFAQFEDTQAAVHNRGRGAAGSAAAGAGPGGAAPGPGLQYVQKSRFSTAGYGAGSHNSDNSDPLGGGYSGPIGPSAMDPKTAPILTGKSAAQTAAAYASERLNPVNAVRNRACENNPAGEYTGPITPAKVRQQNTMNGYTAGSHAHSSHNPVNNVRNRAVENNPAGEYSGAIVPAKVRANGVSANISGNHPNHACPAGVCPSKSPLRNPLQKVGNPIPF